MSVVATERDFVSPPAAPSWMPLSMLAKRFDANLAALATHNPALAERIRSARPAAEYFLRAGGGEISLGTRPIGSARNTDIQPLSHVLPASAASKLAQQIFTSGYCTQSVVIAGEDMGWLWQMLYGAPCNVPTMLSYRPPLFFLINDIDRLRAILHVQQWTTLLADRRVRLYAGPDALAQFRQALVEEVFVPWPRMVASVGKEVWPASVTIDQVLESSAEVRRKRLADLEKQWAARCHRDGQPVDAAVLAGALAGRLSSGRPLKILGVTSRYTTFLQHSMRDWLAGFERAGHQTRLLIESADHEIPSQVVLFEACVEFEPDLIVCIDHCRSTLGPVPAEIPVVMWVQDRLPHIFSREGAAAQGPLDFCLGFGRLHLSQRFGYRAERFLSTCIGVNETRFTAGASADPAADAAFACDVSYVSHASTPADVLITRKMQDATPTACAYLSALHETLRAHYDGGGAVLADVQLRALMKAVALDCRAEIDADHFEPLLGFFRDQIANALFRHGALRWAAEAGADLRLYGRGWDQHPELARFARGEADNTQQLGAIYRASKINLQVTPFGAMHPRLLDGVAGGAFFLIRHSPGDSVGRPHQILWEYCQRHGLSSDAAIRSAAAHDQALGAVVRTIDCNEGYADQPRDLGLYDVCAAHADANFMIAADSVFGDDYDTVAFANREQLHGRLAQFLSNADLRQRTAASMRRAVVDRVSYTAITRQLLKLMATQLESRLPERAAA
jgi:hypothetical protein